MSRYQHYDGVDDEIMDQPEGDEAYEVGYMKPPKETQFKPGQSGNRNGRPKKQKFGPEILQDQLNGAIYVNENGQRVLRTRREVIIQQQVIKAMQGDAKAAAQILARDDQTEHKVETTGKIAEIRWIVIDAPKRLESETAETASVQSLTGADTPSN